MEGVGRGEGGDRQEGEGGDGQRRAALVAGDVARGRPEETGRGGEGGLVAGGPAGGGPRTGRRRAAEVDARGAAGVEGGGGGREAGIGGRAGQGGRRGRFRAEGGGGEPEAQRADLGDPVRRLEVGRHDGDAGRGQGGVERRQRVGQRRGVRARPAGQGRRRRRRRERLALEEDRPDAEAAVGP